MGVMRWVVAAAMFVAPALVVAEERPRLVVTTDIGGDPDDTQSLVRLLVFANEFEIEALVASAAGTPGELKEAVTRPDLIREVVGAYGGVRENLTRHAERYPTAEELLAKIVSGNPQRGVGQIGEEHDTEGSARIIEVVDRDDPRPVNVAIWGGQTDFAQALWRVENDRGADGLREFVAKLRVYDISDQDGLFESHLKGHADLFYILSQAPPGEDKRRGGYRGMYLGGDESLTSREWLDTHVRRGHGPLGALYPPRTWTEPNPHGALKEGDTPSWFYFLPHGLNDLGHLEWGGWGGRFAATGEGRLYRDAADTVDGVTEARAAVWRWRRAYQNEFRARMDWCVKPAEEANHSPRAVVNGDETREVIRRAARPGEAVSLDAEGSSDPDGDRLTYGWSVYREAGTYTGEARVGTDESSAAELRVPEDAAGKSIHVVLEVTDDGEPRLSAFRRVVVEVGE